MKKETTRRQGVPTQADELDAYLTRSENAVSGVKENCEKKIVWHQEVRKRRDLAIVYLHGFSASRMETWPLCDRLAESIGANLFYTRLTGHGQNGEAMAAATMQDWLDDAMEAISIGQRLGRKIIVVGTSTGGTLATWLASQPKTAPLIHRLVLISPNYLPKNPISAITLWPIGIRFLEILFGTWRAFTVTNEMQAKYWTARYPFKAVTPMMQLVWLSWKVDLRNAAMPILMLLNPQDRVINVTLAKTRFSAFPSPKNQLVLFRDNQDVGRHVLAGEMMAPEGTAKAQALIQGFLNGSLTMIQ
jgi:esterase/lipase